LKKKSNFDIAPKQVINKKLILTHWDEILHLMASIKLGYCSASLIFRALSGSKTSKLYQAIKEFGRLLKSTFILNYLRDTALRKSVRKQLNRVELGQRMSKAVFFGRKGILKVGIDDEIQRAVSCTVLLKNVIILWNYLYLSNLLYETENETEKKAMADAVSRGSVIAWAHVNMYGIYLFSKRQKMRSFKATLKQMQNLSF
jgi:TnpA family transposase